MSSQSVQIYRNLLRSVNHAFKGDAAMISGAFKEIRSKFEESKSITDAEQLQELQAVGKEAADFIRMSIVQAPVNERGNLEMVVKPEHTGTYVEPIEPGMDLPKEKRPRKKKE